MYDVVIIGAGITGSAVARYLSRYKGKFLVLEREEDVCCGTTKANSAIVHAGHDAKNGSNMAKYNVKGSEMYPELSKELDFPYEQNGSLVICLSEEDRSSLEALYENGVKNGVKGLEIIDAKKLHELEPNVSDDAVGALYAPTGGIVCPFLANIALAENANANGVEFMFNTEVTEVSRVVEDSSAGGQAAGADSSVSGPAADGEIASEKDKSIPHWVIQTNKGAIDTKYVVNAAGVYADVFHNMVSSKKIHITPRRGDYCLLDHSTEGFVKHTVFQVPGKLGKGVLVTPTVHGNTLVGPTAYDIEDKEGVNTTAEGIDALLSKAGNAVKNLPIREVITSFAGLRAHEDGHDFIIGEPDDAEGFFDCAGIESPGLSSAPAIGLDVADRIASKLNLEENKDFIPTRKGFVDPKTLSLEERNELIKKEPAYGQIICRCEMVTEGQIIDAIRRPIGAKSLDGVKRRVRAGMGRCQAGFCSPRVMEILARELNVPLESITKSGGDSKIIVGYAKDSV